MLGKRNDCQKLRLNVHEDMWNRLSATTDTYLRERLRSLRDVADRLQSYLKGDFREQQAVESNDIIVITKVMGPRFNWIMTIQKSAG